MRRSGWLATLRAAARTPRGAIGLTLTLFVVAVAALGPLLAPHSGEQFVTTPFAPPSVAPPLGGDVLGRDVLSRVLEGGWTLLPVAFAATAFGVVVGAAAGISAAYLRGRADGLIMRSVDVLLAFPQLVLVLLLLSIVGPKLWLIIVAVGLAHAPQVARVLRAATLDVSERDYVKAVELQGVRPFKVMTKEILPNLTTPLMVESGLRLTYSIVIIAGLSFLGFGQSPNIPNWGTMVNENRLGLETNPWAVIVPGLLIVLFAIGTNTFTDAIARVAIGVERRPQELAEVGDPDEEPWLEALV
ncbi:MAG: ABC transporter permease [Actinobacteria bacterium]|nr:ABC transporter permease [Actinomycetota bacterium]